MTCIRPCVVNVSVSVSTSNILSGRVHSPRNVYVRGQTHTASPEDRSAHVCAHPHTHAQTPKKTSRTIMVPDCFHVMYYLHVDVLCLGCTAVTARNGMCTWI